MKLTARKISAMVLCSVFAGLGVVASGCLGPQNQAPTAVAGASSTTAYVTQEITFSGNGSKDSDGSISKYDWDFADGGTGSGVEAKHVYATPGPYKVKLTVTDNGGATASATVDVTILAVGADRDVLFRAYPPNHFVGNDITFIGCDSEDIANADELHWDYGDGKSDMVPYTGNMADCMIKHKYDAKGSKSVKLEVHYKDAGKGSFSSAVGVFEKLTGTNATTFVSSTIGEPDSLDPAYDYETAGVDIISNTYEMLYFYDREKADVFVPVLAESLPVISADGKEYTIQMRKGVKFFSGNEMKASDAAFSMKRLVAMADPSGPSWMLEQVTTAYIGQYFNRTVGDWKNDADGWGHPPTSRLVTALGKADTDIINADDVWKVAGAAFMATGDYTLKIVLEKSYPAVVPVLAFSVGAVTEEAEVKKVCGFPIRNHARCTDVPADGLDTFTSAGTGPYQVEKGDWVAGSSVTLTANPTWWQKEQLGYAQRLDKVVIRIDPALATRVQLLKNGDADTATIGYRDKAQVEGDANLRIIKDLPTFVINIGGMNQDIQNLSGMSIPKDFFADVNVRKAFAYAYNYKDFNDNCIFGGGQQAGGPIPKGMFGYKDVGALLPTYDANKAKEYFMKTPWWNKGFWIEVAYNAGNTARQCAADKLKATIEGLGAPGGFHVNSTAYAWPTYLGRLFSQQLAFFWLGWAPDYADPDDYALPFMRSTGTYPSSIGYKNSSVDALIDEAAAETNLTKRAALYGKIQEAAFYDQPVIWQSQPYAFHVERTWVQGWYYNPMILADYASMMKGT
ncbi:MAG TPA: ABC transporter substrate-binding protein [Thermoplasmata archaeon]|nr:ABC transporter substrate-binding protein [Thermoplasmata archaeon]